MVDVIKMDINSKLNDKSGDKWGDAAADSNGISQGRGIGIASGNEMAEAKSDGARSRQVTARIVNGISVTVNNTTSTAVVDENGEHAATSSNPLKVNLRDGNGDEIESDGGALYTLPRNLSVLENGVNELLAAITAAMPTGDTVASEGAIQDILSLLGDVLAQIELGSTVAKQDEIAEKIDDLNGAIQGEAAKIVAAALGLPVGAVACTISYTASANPGCIRYRMSGVSGTVVATQTVVYDGSGKPTAVAWT